MSDIIERLEEQRQHYCTGACGQSHSVLQQRMKANQVFCDAADEIERLTRRLAAAEAELERLGRCNEQLSASHAEQINHQNKQLAAAEAREEVLANRLWSDQQRLAAAKELLCEITRSSSLNVFL